MAAPPPSGPISSESFSIGPQKLPEGVTNNAFLPLPPHRIAVLDDGDSLFHLIPRKFTGSSSRYVADPDALVAKLPPIDRKLGEFELIDDVRNFAKGSTNYRLIKNSMGAGMLFMSLKGLTLWTRIYVPRLRLSNHALLAEISQEMSQRGLRLLPLQSLIDELMKKQNVLPALPFPNFEFSAEDLKGENVKVSGLVNWLLGSMPSIVGLVCFWQMDWDGESDGSSTIRFWFFNTSNTSATATAPVPAAQSAKLAFGHLFPSVAENPPPSAPLNSGGSSFMRDMLKRQRKDV